MATWFLIIIYLSFISLGLPDSLLGSAWPVMRQDLGSSLGAAGILSMIAAGGTILSSLASGKVVGKLGTGKVTLISCIMTAGALLGYAMSPSFIWLAVMAVPLGLGAGSVDAALNNFVAQNYKAHHMNWLHCFWGVGATLGPILMSAFISKNNSWRGGYLAVSMIQFTLVVILFVTLPLWNKVAKAHEAQNTQADSQELANPEATEEKSSVFRIKGVKATLIAFLLYCASESMVGLWGASYLVGSRDVLAETAAGWVSLYYGGITMGRLITGFITLKVGNRTLIRWGQLIAISGGIFILLPLPAVFSLIGFILIGLGLAPIYPGLIHETPVRFGSNHSAALIGYQMAVAYTGSTFLPPIFGAIAGKTSIGIFPFVVLAFLLLMLLSVEKVNLAIRQREKGR